VAYLKMIKKLSKDYFLKFQVNEILNLFILF